MTLRRSIRQVIVRDTDDVDSWHVNVSIGPILGLRHVSRMSSHAVAKSLAESERVVTRTGLRDASDVLEALDRCADALAADFQRMTALLRTSVAESAVNTLEHARLYREIATSVQVRWLPQSLRRCGDLAASLSCALGLSTGFCIGAPHPSRVSSGCFTEFQRNLAGCSHMRPTHVSAVPRRRHLPQPQPPGVTQQAARRSASSSAVLTRSRSRLVPIAMQLRACAAVIGSLLAWWHRNLHICRPEHLAAVFNCCALDLQVHACRKALDGLEAHVDRLKIL